MSLQRIIELQLNANGVARGLKDIQAQLKGVDSAIKGVNSAQLNLGGGTGSGSTSNAPIQKARRALIDYEGQLSNVQRTITQTIGTQTRAEAVMLKYDTVTRKLNKSLAEGRLSQSEYNQALLQANSAFTAANKQAQDYDAQLNKMVASSGKTTGAFNAMRGGAANFSYQLQDVIVQMQMGTAFGTIIAQQGPQIASIFGAGGAALGVVIALAGALGGVLLNNLNDSTDAMGDLTKQTEEMNKAFKSIDGVVKFTDDLQELVKQSEALADLKIQTQLAEIAQSASNLRNALAQAFEGAGGSSWVFFDAINLDAVEESFNAIAKAGLEVNDVLSNTMTQEDRSRLGQYLGSLYPLNSNLRAIQESFNVTRGDAVSFVDSMIALRDTSNLTTDQIDEMASSIRLMINAALESSNTTDKQRGRLVDLSNAMVEFISNARQVVEVQDQMTGRNVSAFALPFSEAAINTAQLAEGLDDVSDLIISIQDEYSRLNDLQLAVNDSGFSSRAYQAAQENALQFISDYLYDLGEEINIQEEINALREQGLQISQEQAGILERMVGGDFVADIIDDNVDTDVADLTRQIERLQAASEDYANDPSFQEALRSLQDELIEATQGSYALEDASDAVNQALRFQGADAAIAVLDELRAMALITTEQYNDMKREIDNTQRDIGRTSADAIADLDAEIAAYERGADAVEAYNRQQQARSALGLSGMTAISPEQQDALDEYIAKLERFDSLRDGSIPSNFAASIGEALASQDYSSFADVLASQVSGSIGTAVTNAVGGTVGGLAGGLIGGAAGVVIDDVLNDLFDSVDIAEIRQTAQGTGTVLGDVNAKSESILDATEYAADSLDDILGVNNGMLNELRALNSALTGAAGLISRDVNFQGIAGGLGLSSTGRAFSSIGQPAAQLAGFGALTGVGMNLALGGGTLASAALGGAGGALTGGLTAATGGLAAGIFAADQLLLDGAISDLIGGVFDSVAGALFGKSSVSDEGIRILGGTIEDILESTTAEAYQTVRKKSLFSSSTSEHYRAASDAVETQFDLVFQSLFNTVEAAATGLGFNQSDIQNSLNTFVVESFRISLRDLSPEEQAEELNAVFSSVFDRLAESVVPTLREFQQAGEGMGETLSRVSTNFSVVGEAINQLNINALSGSTDNMIRASERFVDFFGDAGGLVSSFTGFIDTFATEERQLEILTSGLTRALGEQDVAILRSRDGVYDYISALDVSNAADAERIANILSLTDSLDEYYSLLESVYQSQTDSAFRVLEKAINAERQQLASAYQENVEAIEKSTEGFSDIISALQSLSNSLDSALSASRVDTFDLNFARLQAARSVISTTAQSRIVPTDGRLDNAIESLSGDNEQFYSDFESYAIAQAAQVADIKLLKELTDDQLDATQSAEDIAESQLEVLREQYELDVKALDDQLAYAQEQIDIARDSYDELTDISSAMDAFLAAIGNEINAGEVQTSSISSSEIGRAYDYLQQQNTSGGVTDWDAADYQAGLAAINAGISSEQLASSLGVSASYVQQRAEELGLPAFASGGFHAGGMRLVGERGAEMELTGPSRIFSASQTSNIVAGANVGAAEVVAALAYTNQLLRDLNVKMIESNDNTDRLNDFAVNSMPVTIIADQTV